MDHRVEAQIDLAALKHNLQVIKSLTPKQAVVAMVKANGYGHGLIRVANALTEAESFGVASIAEALTLRAANIKQPILLMTGIFSSAELITAATENFAVIVHNPMQLEIIEKTALKNPVKVWLKIDTGMHRLGFPLEKFNAVYQWLRSSKNVHPDIVLMTHLASADDVNNVQTSQQIASFLHITKNFKELKSIANSAGIIAWPQSHANWVRPGIMLYGISPMQKSNEQTVNLKPVMTLQAKIIATHFLHRGDAIGYGATWLCPEDMPVAVVSIGYGDGYPRQLKSGTPVLINNARCPLVGRVSMDMISIDIRNYPSATVGDSVTLWGKGLSAAEVASYADTIAYTLFCGITQRVNYREL